MGSNILCNEQEGDDYIIIATLENINMTKTDFEDVDTLSLCTSSSVLGRNCGDYSECADSTLNYENKAICCSATGACSSTSTSLSVNSNTMDWYLLWCLSIM